MKYFRYLKRMNERRKKMAVCRNCGAQIGDNDSICSNCGANQQAGPAQYNNPQ